MTVQLSSVEPDYEQIRAQIVAEIIKVEGGLDFITASTGSILVDAISAIGAFDQLAIERALQETHLSTARLVSSVVSIMNMLGNRTKRRIPARVSVRIERADASSSLVIPRFTTFDLEGTLLFNRKDFSMAAGDQVLNEILYEGTLQTETFISRDQQSFQRFSLGSTPFIISDEDVYCSVGPTAETYERVTEGLWNYGSTDKVFYENTQPNGNVGILFGNGVYGQIPPVNTPINFTYFETNGEEANRSAENVEITVATFPQLIVTATSALSLGQEIKEASFYKDFGGSLYGGRGRSVTRKDYRALAIEFPGVVDAKFRGQAEIAPNEHSWMNMVQVLLLTSNDGGTTITNWSDSEWNQFVEFFDERGWFSAYLIRRDPDQIPVDIEMEIFAHRQENLSTLENDVKTEIRNFFKLGPNSIGKSLFLSDLSERITSMGGANRRIDYIKILIPQTDLLVGALDVNVLRDIDLKRVEYTNRNTDAVVTDPVAT